MQMVEQITLLFLSGSHTRMIKIGDIIDSRYSVLSHLGTGGMAVVFECKDLFSGKVVAVKILKEELLGNKNLVEDFSKEVKASISMSHENIMEIYQEGVWNNRPYLVSEYLKSQTLLDKIEFYTKFSLNEAYQIMIQLLRAISYIHAHKIIHRDIKPQNVFYLPNGTIKLGDFGIAKNENEYSSESEIMGSIHYLAPEIIQGKKFSVQSDIYAAGITFFQLITGILPFDGSTKEIAEQQISKEFPKPSKVVSGLNKDVDSIILKAVSKNQNSRYKSADDFLKDVIAASLGKKIKKGFLERFF